MAQRVETPLRRRTEETFRAFFRPLLPEAIRLKGTYEWLRRRPAAAEKW